MYEGESESEGRGWDLLCFENYSLPPDFHSQIRWGRFSLSRSQATHFLSC